MRVIWLFPGSTSPSVPRVSGVPAVGRVDGIRRVEGSDPPRHRVEPVIVVSAKRGEAGVVGAGRARDDVRLSDEAIARDREVRTHEAAHLSALGPHAASGVMYDTVSTPAGAVATGGRIKVDLAPVPGDPEATLRKANAIARAAFAPGDASPADERVAADARALAAKARDEIAARYRGETVPGEAFDAFA